MNTGAINHLKLTVSDVKRAHAFYTDILGFELMGGSIEGGHIALSNGSIFLGIGKAADATQSPENDRFSEHRIGLDHLSISVDSHADLLAAQKRFDEHGIVYGEIKDLREAGFPLYVMAFRDPDNIQLEFSAPVTE